MVTSDNNFYRRQFVIGPKYLDFVNWNKVEIDGSLCLTIHPDLPFEQNKFQNKSITLLGYLIDTENPSASNQDIIEDVIRQIESIDDVFEHIDRICGRFVIIVKCDSHILIFQDACGLRQVFYSTDKHGNYWFASQPHIIARLLNYQFYPEIESLKETYLFKKGEYSFPGTSTAYKGIFHLQPNHYYDLTTGKVVRFWPTGKLPELTLLNSIEKCSQILQNTMKAACARFDLALGVTAGIDTRILLAATKDVKDKILYFTNMHYDENYPDIRIPANLLPRLGITHHVFRNPPESDTFKESYYESTAFARPMKSTDIHCTFKNIKPGVVLVNGNVAEIGRCFYHLWPQSKTDARGLSALMSMADNPFAVKHFEEWLSDAKTACQKAGINIKDMFYWEDRMGNWAAMTFSEADIAYEIFPPFNCRSLLANILSVNPKYRKPPSYTFHKRLAEYMWPETMQEPVNPPANFQQRIKSILQRLPIGPYINYLRIRHKKNL